MNKALEKDREVRYQHASDLRADLKRLRRDMESGRTVPSAEAVTATSAGVVQEAGSRRELPVIRKRWKLLLSAVLGALLIGLGIAWFATHRVPSAATELKQRTLTANANDNPVQTAVISPDGKYIAYGDESGVHIKLIETGETQTIPPPTSLKAVGAHWWPSAWFPDGTKLLVSALEPTGLHASLWKVSILSGMPHEFRDNAFTALISPDGSRIAFTSGLSMMGVRELWVMGPNGEESRKLVALDGNSAFQALSWSPDGQRIAYLKFHQAPDRPENSIESLDPRSNQPNLIFSDPKLLDFCWLRDGRVIYTKFELPRNEGDANFWQIRVNTRTGEPVDKPRRLTNWAGFMVVGLSRTVDGKRVAFLKGTFHSNVYVGDLQANGTRLKAPRRLTLGEYNNFPTAWTKDSKAVLFGSIRDGRYEILKQALDQDSVETLVTGKTYSEPRLSADGSWALYTVSPENAGPTTPVNVMRVPVSGGPPQFIMAAHGLQDVRCARSPATLCVIGERSPDRRQLTFTSCDPVHGRGRELTKIEADPAGVYSFDVSPDASRLAVEKRGDSHIQVLPLDGGAPHDVNVNGWGALNSLDWTADGKGFFASSESPQGVTLLHIDLQGNAQALWRRKGSFLTWGVPSPDGKRLAILGATLESNVWMMENF